MEIVIAPFSKDQVESLNAYQVSGVGHPFTCGNNSDHDVLEATVGGWICYDCDYTQNWAHKFMADWSWSRTKPEPMEEKTLLKNKSGELFYFRNGHYWKADRDGYGGWIPIDLDVMKDDITPANPPTKCRFCGGTELVLRGLGVDCEVVYVCTNCNKFNEVLK